MNKRQTVNDGDIQVAENLLLAAVAEEKIVGALAYRGLDSDVAAELVANLRGGKRPSPPLTPLVAAPTAACKTPAGSLPPPLAGRTPAPPPGWWDAQFSKTPRIALILAGICLGLPTLVLGILALGFASEPKARRNAGFAVVISLIGMVAVAALFSYSDRQLKEISQLLPGGDSTRTQQAAHLRAVLVQSSNMIHDGWSHSATNPEAVYDTAQALQQAWLADSKTLTGDPKTILEASAAFVQRVIDVSSKVDRVGESLDQSLNFTGVRTADQLDAKARLLLDASAELEEAQGFFGDFAGNYNKEVSKYKLDPKVAQTMVAGMRRNSAAYQRAMDQLLSALAAACRDSQAAQGFLKTNWGAWSVSSSGVVRMANPMLSLEYSNYQSKIQSSMALILAAQNQMLNAYPSAKGRLVERKAQPPGP